MRTPSERHLVCARLLRRLSVIVDRHWQLADSQTRTRYVRLMELIEDLEQQLDTEATTLVVESAVEHHRLERRRRQALKE